jgi:UbiD family decarboxylase
MAFADLREFIEKTKEWGECKVIEGADCDLELGIITEIEDCAKNPSVLLFDRIKGYKPGYRVVSNLFSTLKRQALALGLPLEAGRMELVKAWREKAKGGIVPVPPVEVETGPVKENVLVGDEVNLLEFPAPRWHERDGGRYIGTGDMVINRDPDGGWVNLGTHRVQVQDKRTVTIHMSPGRHCELIASKYWDKGQSCPVVITCGQDPGVWAMSSIQVPWGVSEYDYAGWLRGAPVEVTKGVVTGLPIPATAEIALEGEFVSPEVEMRPEGPFGEWPLHYGKGRRGGQAPVVRVKSILHRNNPIIQGAPPLVTSDQTIGDDIRRSAAMWDELDRQMPGVKGVWQVREAGCFNMVVVSIEQQYLGHAKQAALLIPATNVGRYMLKYVIVVDEDVDPSNITEVLWALGSRTDPVESIDFIRGCLGSQTDPYVSPMKRGMMDYTHSTALIMACKPYHWIKEFAPTIKTSADLLQKTRDKWAGYVG